MKLLLKIALLIVLVSLTPLPAFAQGEQPRPVTDDEVNRVAKQLYCPVCENTPLDVCPTQACAQWRDLIREKLSQGWTETQIKQYFVDQYGDRVLATPPARGLNWLVYIIPPLSILAGAYLLYRALLAWRKPVGGLAQDEFSLTQKLPKNGLPQNGLPEDEYVRRLEEELRSR